MTPISSEHTREDAPSSPVTADDYERRIREKVFNANILTRGEWVFLVGLFQRVRECDDVAATASEPVAPSSPDIVERMKNYIDGEHDDYIPEVLQLACAEIERLRAQAAIARNTMSEWQPIETAPKDGTPIICFTPDENFSEKTGFDLIWWEPSEGAWFYGAADFFSASPTHWIPLPRSPQSGAPAQPSRAADRTGARQMNDLIQRLRAHYPFAGLPREAADRIEALEAALRKIVNGGTMVLLTASMDECPVNPDVLEQIINDARAALARDTVAPQERADG